MRKLETPAYIVKEEVLENSINSLNSALSNNFKNSIFSYSLKTNSLPYILERVKSHGGFAEVVSSDEYELARLVGFDINKIVYNGPLKCKNTFIEAVTGGAIVNIETKREIKWLNELPKDQKYSVGIRVNIDLADISPDDAKENEDYSRFGFSSENNELEQAITDILKYKNIKLVGLHVHRTTLSRSVNVYERVASYVSNIAKKHSLDLKYIDIGGGFYGIMEGKPTFDEYFKAIKKGLESYFDLNLITIIVEPGNAIVASAIDFISAVIDVKKIRDFYLITTDGSRNDLDPFYKKSKYFHSLIYNDSKESQVPLQIVGGGTCLEYDKIFEVENQNLLAVGDFIKYESVGAYTMTLSPLFIRFFPNVYLKDTNGYRLIRKKWSASDFYNIYKTED